jgi:puromycin-sensitive aminopeptidase
MENWGLLTFDKGFLLVDSLTSFQRRQRIARLVCHEVCHQWFGNMVTMAWWRYLWLKEGMARYLEYVFVTSFFPEWDYWAHFVEEIFQPAMDRDERRTHPVESNVYLPKEIASIFDPISYGKGASVLRMLALHMGEQNFFEGLRMFLHKFQYTSATSTDLWNCFSKVTNEDIDTLMNYWICWPGHPFLFVTPNASKSTNERLVFDLALFFETYSEEEFKCPDAGSFAFQIPLLVKHSGHPTPFKFVLTQKETEIEIPLSLEDQNAWIKFNWQHSGFYRVNYTNIDLWRRLAKATANKELPSTDVKGLRSDFTMFSFLGLVDDPPLLEFWSKLNDSSVENGTTTGQVPVQTPSAVL